MPLDKKRFPDENPKAAKRLEQLYEPNDEITHALELFKAIEKSIRNMQLPNETKKLNDYRHTLRIVSKVLDHVSPEVKAAVMKEFNKQPEIYKLYLETLSKTNKSIEKRGNDQSATDSQAMQPRP